MGDVKRNLVHASLTLVHISINLLHLLISLWSAALWNSPSCTHVSTFQLFLPLDTWTYLHQTSFLHAHFAFWRHWHSLRSFTEHSRGLKKKKKSTFRLGILIHLGLFRIWKRGWTPRAFEETLVFVFADRGGVMLWAWIADLIISAVSMATKYVCQSDLSLPSQRVHIHSNTQGDSLTTSITASYCTTR